MFHKKQSFYCLVCGTRMSYFNLEKSEIEQCPDADCRITWQYKLADKKFVAIDWPGKKKDRQGKCGCSSCKPLGR